MDVKIKEKNFQERREVATRRDTVSSCDHLFVDTGKELILNFTLVNTVKTGKVTFKSGTILEVRGSCKVTPDLTSRQKP